MAKAAPPPRRSSERPRKAEAVIEPQAKHQFGEERHDAGDDDGDHHHAHVAVADMGQLVAEHGFDLGIVEPVEQSGRDRDRILLVAHAGGEGIERVALHHLELGHGDAARDAQIFQDIVEPRFLGARHFPAAGQRIDHVLVEVIGDDHPQRGADGRPRRGVEKIGPRQLHQHIAVGVDRERFRRQRAGIDHQVDEEEQPDEQRDRAPPVRLDMAIEPVCGHR